MVGHFPGAKEGSPGSSPGTEDQDTLQHACKPSTQKAGAGELRAQSHPWLQKELETSMGYKRAYLRKPMRQRTEASPGGLLFLSLPSFPRLSVCVVLTNRGRVSRSLCVPYTLFQVFKTVFTRLKANVPGTYTQCGPRRTSPKRWVTTVLSKNVQCKFSGSEAATTSRRR